MTAFTSRYRALRATVRYRRRYDAERSCQYVIVEREMLTRPDTVYSVAVLSARGTFLTLV